MTYKETLDYLYRKLPMYQRVGHTAFKKGLGNTIKLLDFLGNPHEDYPKIHIAGTNGKGTVSHMLAAAYQAEGYTVGLYTSPHYRDFRERFKVNGKMVSKRYISRFVERIKPAIEEIEPSFFEITVAMAFDAFRAAGADIAVIETGLGGRLDSTNVIDPLISVITNISFDHMEMLGDTLPAIAREKAGIIKKGRPVVIGRSQPETDPVFIEKANEMKAPIVFADKVMEMTSTSSNTDSIAINQGAIATCRVTYQSGKVQNYRIPSLSPFVAENLITALESLEILMKMDEAPRLTAEAVKEGLEQFPTLTNYIGRWQILQNRPLVIADSAHNEAGLARTLPAVLKMRHDKLHIVLGVVREKDLNKALTYFPKDAKYYFCRPNVPRGLEANMLADAAAQKGLMGKSYSTVRRALAAAKRRAGKNDLIFVGGSSFVVAEAL